VTKKYLNKKNNHIAQISSFLDEQVLAFLKIISHSMVPNTVAINLVMGMSKMEEKERACVNQLLQIFKEEKSPIRFLSCRLANLQYLQHVDSQTSRLHLDGYEESDIPHLVQILASHRPDGHIEKFAFFPTFSVIEPLIVFRIKKFSQKV
jgi:hypothetical protein